MSHDDTATGNQSGDDDSSLPQIQEGQQQEDSADPCGGSTAATGTKVVQSTFSTAVPTLGVMTLACFLIMDATDGNMTFSPALVLGASLVALVAVWRRLLPVVLPTLTLWTKKLFCGDVLQSMEQAYFLDLANQEAHDLERLEAQVQRYAHLEQQRRGQQDTRRGIWPTFLRVVLLLVWFVFVRLFLYSGYCLPEKCPYIKNQWLSYMVWD